jgi:hypothetical protein
MFVIIIIISCPCFDSKVFNYKLVSPVTVFFTAVSAMPAAERPASTGDVNTTPSSRCHPYDLRAKSYSTSMLPHSRTALAANESPLLSPFVPSKRRRLSSSKIDSAAAPSSRKSLVYLSFIMQ